jgi:hypothetical protein
MKERRKLAAEHFYILLLLEKAKFLYFKCCESGLIYFDPTLINFREKIDTG